MNAADFLRCRAVGIGRLGRFLEGVETGHGAAETFDVQSLVDSPLHVTMLVHVGDDRADDHLLLDHQFHQVGQREPRDSRVEAADLTCAQTFDLSAHPGVGLPGRHVRDHHSKRLHFRRVVAETAQHRFETSPRLGVQIFTISRSHIHSPVTRRKRPGAPYTRPVSLPSQFDSYSFVEVLLPGDVGVTGAGDCGVPGAGAAFLRRLKLFRRLISCTCGTRTAWAGSRANCEPMLNAGPATSETRWRRTRFAPAMPLSIVRSSSSTDVQRLASSYN